MTTPQEKHNVLFGLLKKSDVSTHRDHGTKHGRDPPPRPSIRLWYKKFMETETWWLSPH